MGSEFSDPRKFGSEFLILEKWNLNCLILEKWGRNFLILTAIRFWFADLGSLNLLSSIGMANFQ